MQKTLEKGTFIIITADVKKTTKNKQQKIKVMIAFYTVVSTYIVSVVVLYTLLFISVNRNENKYEYIDSYSDILPSFKQFIALVLITIYSAPLQWYLVDLVKKHF